MVIADINVFGQFFGHWVTGDENPIPMMRQPPSSASFSARSTIQPSGATFPLFHNGPVLPLRRSKSRQSSSPLSPSHYSLPSWQCSASRSWDGSLRGTLTRSKSGLSYWDTAGVLGKVNDLVHTSNAERRPSRPFCGWDVEIIVEVHDRRGEKA